MGRIIGSTTSYGGAITFRDGVCWAGIRSGLFKSIDSGVTWSSVSMPTNGLITDISFFDKNVGTVALYSSGIYRTTDQGNSWTQILPLGDCLGVATGSNFQEIYAINRSSGGVVYTSLNGGVTWTNQQVENNGGAYSIIYDHRTNIPYVLSRGINGYNSHVEFSSNSGATWIKQPGNVNLDSYHFSLDSCDPNMIYIANEQHNEGENGFSEIYVSKDKGSTYQSVIQKSLSFFSASISASQNAIFVGSSGSTYRSTDQGVSWIDIGGPGQSPDTRLVCAINDNLILASDNNGNIWRTTNSGGFPINSGHPYFSPIGILKPSQCNTDSLHIVITGVACSSVVITKAIITGGDSSQFSLDPTVLPKALIGSQSTTFVIHFNSSPNDKSYTTKLRVSITNISTGVSYDTLVDLAAIVTPEKPNLIASPPIINFGQTSVCNLIKDSLIRLTNRGCDTLNIISGPGGLSPGFTIDSIYFPITLPPDSSIWVRAHFNPHIATSYQTEAKYDAEHEGLKQSAIVSLMGYGVGQSSKPLFDSQLNFIPIPLCIGHADTVVTIINSGCDTVWITSGPGSLGNGFTTDPIHYPIVLPPDSIASFVFHFNSTVIGQRQFSTTFSILEDGEVKDINLRLNGSVNSSKAGPVLSNNQLTFGNTSVCDSMQDSIAVFTNRGCDTLTILSGPGNLAKEFGQDQVTFPIILPPDSSIVIHFHFHASAVGSYQTQATYKTQRPGCKPETVTLTLNGKNNGSSGGPIVLNTSFIFDTVSLCATGRDTTITFSNHGCDTLRILSGPGNLGAGFNTDQLTYPIVIPPDSSVTIVFHFAPSAAGDFKGYPHFVTERSGQQGTLDLFLQGSATPGGSIFSLLTPTLAFMPLSICSTDSLEIVYTNIGCDSVFVTPVGISGDADFSATSGREKGVAAKDSIHIKVILLPTQQGQRTATYTLRLRDRNGSTRDTQITITGLVTPGSTTLKLSDSTLAFGTTTLCASPDTIITLYNRGCDTLWVTSLLLKGSGFSINELTPFFILPGENHQITVHTVLDTANRQSSNNGVITITSNSQDPLPSIILSRGYVYPKNYTIRLEMPVTRAGTRDTVVVRVIADSLPTDVTTITASYQVANSDLLSYVKNISDNIVTVTPTDIAITGTPIRAKGNLIAELYYAVFLTKDTTTSLTFTNAHFNPAELSYENCIATVTAAGNGFNYEFACGEHTVQTVIRGEVLKLVSISPNPTSGGITLAIESPAELRSGIEIYDMLGKKVFAEERNFTRGKNSFPIDTKSFASGMYSVVLRSGAGSITTTFVKNN